MSAQRQVIHTDKAPKAIGPYSQAIRAGNTVYVSGQLGIDPESGNLRQGLEEQTDQALKNMGEILKQAGSSYKGVVKTTILLRDIADFAAVNKVYEKYFTEQPPARATYAVAGLPKDGLVEIEAVAIVDE